MNPRTARRGRMQPEFVARRAARRRQWRHAAGPRRSRDRHSKPGLRRSESDVRWRAPEIGLALDQPDHAPAFAAHRTEGLEADQARALPFLDPRRRVVAFVVADPEVGPVEVAEGVVGHPIGGLGHQASPLELGIEPEAAHVAALPVVGPEVDAADQLVRPVLQADRPVVLLAARHLALADLDEADGAVVGIGPGHAWIEVAHDLPARKAALDDRGIRRHERTQEQPLGLEHRRRRKGLFEDRHVRSRLRCRRSGTCRSAPHRGRRGWEGRLQIR